MNKISQPTLVHLIESHVTNSWVGTKGSDLIQFRDYAGNWFQIKEAMKDIDSGYLECIRISDNKSMAPELKPIRSGNDAALKSFVQEVAEFVSRRSQP